MYFRIDKKKIIKFLFDNQLTISAFSRGCNLSFSAIRNVLNGGDVHIPTVAKIAEFMKCDPKDLIREE